MVENDLAGVGGSSSLKVQLNKPQSSTSSSSSAKPPLPPKSSKSKGKQRAVEPEEEENYDLDDSMLIHPDLLFEKCMASAPKSSASTSAGTSKGGGVKKSHQATSKEKPLKPSTSNSKSNTHSTSSKPGSSSKSSSTSASTATNSSTSSTTSKSKEGKGKAKEKDAAPREPAPLFLSELPEGDTLKILCAPNQSELDAKCRAALARKKKAEGDVDLSYKEKAKLGKGNNTGKKGKALKKKRNKRWGRMDAGRSRLRAQQSATFEEDRLQLFRMLRQNLELCKRSLNEIALDDPLVGYFDEIRQLSQHKNFVSKTQTGLLWYLQAFDTRIVAGIAHHLLSSGECVKLLQQLRTGDPEWETTLETLPEVTPDMGNLLVYLLSSLPSDIDGPLPLPGTALAKKVGFTVDLAKRQVYGGSAFGGAAVINEELQKKGITNMGRVLEKVEIEEGETAETGGGLRVHGHHLSQEHRLKVKLSQNSKPFVASSESYKARYGVPDTSPQAFTVAIENDSKTIESNSDSKIPFNPSVHAPRVFAFVDNAPSVVAASMESLEIIAAQLANRSTLYVEAAKDLKIKLESSRPFESRNKELGMEDRTSSWFDSESQRARGTASLLKQWEFDRPRMIARCVKGGQASAARTLGIIRDRNLLAWLEGHDSYLHWAGRGWGQRKPAVALKAVDEGRSKAEKKRDDGTSADLNATNPLLNEVLTPYPRDIPDSRSKVVRTPQQEERAKALVEDHVKSINKFTPLFPPDRDSLQVEEYDYKFKFKFVGKRRTFDLEFKKEDLVKQSDAAREWFTAGGCRNLDSLAVNLSRRLRKQEREGMSEIVDRFLKDIEVAYDSEEEDEVDDDEEEEDEDGDTEMGDEEDEE
ncbi:hypothetical protein JCM5350_002122 [Sporobolomyces pararoseus]